MTARARATGAGGALPVLDILSNLSIAVGLLDGEGEVIGGAKLGPEALKSIRSLEKRVSEHIKKLEDYRNNPLDSDNTGRLASAIKKGADWADKVYHGRIHKLEEEIETFRRRIAQIGGQ